MLRSKSLYFFLFIPIVLFGQQRGQLSDSSQVESNHKKVSPFSTGYYPIGFFDVDLKYLIKYNNYESFRLGFGGITNERLSDWFTFGGYTAYGFKDHNLKYGINGNLRISESSKTWIGLDYTKDISEIGSYTYLTNKRVYSVFEPRLINITQFYKYRRWGLRVGTEPSEKIMADLLFSHARIEQIENYFFVNEGLAYQDYYLAEATVSVRYAPKTRTLITEDGTIEKSDVLPKVSAQISQGIKGIAKSDFNYWKVSAKLDYLAKRENLSSTHLVLEGAMAFGDVPLTHLFHAYPNNPTKDEILQRFSVAGRQSFETMYFGEFFSSKLLTFRGKHSFRRFNLGKKWKPEFVLISRHAIGGLDDRERHLGLDFNTLDELYSESGFEINKLVFGFGLSFSYRYGFYHLPKTADNVSFKFTFNLKL